MNIYKIKQDGESHWIAANSPEEAFLHGLEEMTLEMESEYTCEEVPDIEKDEIILDRNEPEPDIENGEKYSEGYDSSDYQEGYLICGKLRDLASSVSRPTIIASTLY